MPQAHEYWREMLENVKTSDVVCVTLDNGTRFSGQVVDVDDFAVKLETEQDDKTLSHVVDLLGIVAVSTDVRHA